MIATVLGVLLAWLLASVVTAALLSALFRGAVMKGDE